MPEQPKTPTLPVSASNKLYDFCEPTFVEPNRVSSSADSSPQVAVVQRDEQILRLFDLRKQSHESSVANTLLCGKPIFSLKEEDKQITAAACDASDDVHGVEQSRRVFDNTVCQLTVIPPRAISTHSFCRIPTTP